MSSILEVPIDSEEFVLGRILDVDSLVTSSLPEVSRAGNRSTPYGLFGKPRETLRRAMAELVTNTLLETRSV